MNTKGITIKITTGKVITLLEDKLKVTEREFADYPAIEQAYDNAIKAWQKKCATIALKNASKALENTIVEDYAGNTPTTRATFWFSRDLFPDKPNKPSAIKFGKYQVENEIRDLKDTIRMLKLHEGDTISTATYKSVSRFL